MSDLRPISDSVARLTKDTFSRKFVSLGRILSSWAYVVGPELAGRTQPLKLHYRKPKNDKEKPQASLDIAVTSADATLLHYQKDLILERINQLFGERWVNAIRFVHAAANTDQLEETRSPLAAIRLTPEQQASVKEVVSGVADEEIRNKLEKLGQDVLKRRNRDTRP